VGWEWEWKWELRVGLRQNENDPRHCCRRSSVVRTGDFRETLD